MKRLIHFAWLLLVVAGTSGAQSIDVPHPPVFVAQTPPGEMAREQMLEEMGPFGDGDPEEHGRLMERLRLLKMLELVDPATDDAEMKLLSSYRQYRQDLVDLSRRHRDLVDRLADTVKSEKLSAASYRTFSDELNRLELERIERQAKFFADAAGYLTIEQQGKLRVYEERIELEILSRLKQFHKGPRGFFKDEFGKGPRFMRDETDSIDTKEERTKP